MSKYSTPMAVPGEEYVNIDLIKGREEDFRTQVSEFMLSQDDRLELYEQITEYIGHMSTTRYINSTHITVAVKIYPWSKALDQELAKLPDDVRDNAH